MAQALGEPLPEDILECMLRVADLDGNGKVSFEEFYNLLAEDPAAKIKKEQMRRAFLF